MKKTLLILAIAAGGALHAHAQGQIQLVNNGFEDTTHTADSLKGWSYTGQVRFPNQVGFIVGGQPQTQIPYDGSSRFIEVKAKKQDTGNLYNRGIIRQAIKIPTSGVNARPTYMQFVVMYVPGGGNGSDAFFARVSLTKYDFTTGGHDTIGTVAGATTSAIYPWTKVYITINYKRNDTPDSAFVEFWANAANTLSPNTVLYLEDVRFEDRNPAGVQLLNQSLADHKVFPNPMTSSSTITYTLIDNSPVSINVYDISGRLVRTIFNGNLPKGEHKAIFERGNLQAGMYIYKIQAGAQVETGKIIIGQ
jgi:hypothetical protein